MKKSRAVVPVAAVSALLAIAPGAIAAPKQPKLNPVVFVHGFVGSGAQFQSQQQRFTSNGYPQRLISALDYDSTFGLATREQVYARLDDADSAAPEALGPEEGRPARALARHRAHAGVPGDARTRGARRALRQPRRAHRDGASRGVPTLAVWADTGGGQLAGLQAEWQGKRSQAGKATEEVDELIESFGRVTPAFQEDVSGIIYWDNEGAESSPITAPIPIATPRSSRTRFGSRTCRTTCRSTAACRRSDFLASGHWPNPDPSAGGSPVIVHGPNTAGTARITLFGLDPLFRAHPERSYPAVSEGFYWGDN